MTLFKNRNLVITLIVFGLVYSLISLVNHYCFRTYALDLGAYTNALYDYVHFQWNDSTVFKEIPENLLADHFDLYLILFSPFSLIFQSYTLLIFQILFVLIGGIGVFKYFSLSERKTNLPIVATICFYSFFGIFSALSCDYHSNVIAAMVVPWFFFYFKQSKYRASFIVLIFILISKENISLWMTFICLGLLFEYKKNKRSVQYLVLFSSISLVYFMVISGVVMPALSANGTYPHFNYSVLGNTVFGALTHLLTHPVEAVKTLFINHTNHPFGNYVKLELHIFLLLSGLYMLIFKPWYLIMLIPIYFQKLFNDNYIIWGIDGQYAVEFAPVIIIGAFSVIGEIRKEKWGKIVTVLVFIGILSSTIRMMDSTTMYTNKSKVRIYQCSHYKRDYNGKLVYEQIDKIPESAVVSAQSSFLPHLALRDHIYLFPIVKDADYIVYSVKEEPYPLTKEAFNIKIQDILNSKEWKDQFRNEDIVILKRVRF